MHRFLVIFPRSADKDEVEALIESIGSSLRAKTGSRSVTRNAGPLMGPGAQAGEAGWIFEADFDGLEDAMAALGADDFQDVRKRAEAMTTSIFMFEVGEV